MNQLFSERFKKHPHYTAFLKIAKPLQDGGWVCWVAGGAVRDILRDRNVHDIDLVTNADFEILKQLFPKAILVGASFGVLKVSQKAETKPENDSVEEVFFDLAIFRKEYEYLDGRRPSKVIAGTPEEDALRRDFTINALYWDEKNQKVIDYAEGLQDLQLRRLRCVGNPEERFLEDHLRVLRLLRFHAQLRFDVDAASLAAAENTASLLKKISGERIWDEFKKIAQAKNYDLLAKSSLTSSVLAEVFEIDKKLCQASKINFKTLADKKINDLIIFYDWLLQVLIDENSIRKTLKDRLHVSKKEVQLFDQVVFVVKKLIHFSSEQIVVELEKEASLLALVSYFSETQVLDFGKYQKVVQLLDNKPAPVIQAVDLVAWVPAEKISQALSEARLRQLEGVFYTKDEGILYLRRWLKQ